MIVEPLSAIHDRLGFSSGNEKLDRYLHDIAHQAQHKRLAAVFVGVDASKREKVLGYYSLSSYTITGAQIPSHVRKARKLPSHVVGATLLGRLAVSAEFQGKGIGALLLADALKRSFHVAIDVGSVCVVVDAVDDRGVPFYERFGFVRLEEHGLRLALMMDTIAGLVNRS